MSAGNLSKAELALLNKLLAKAKEKKPEPKFTLGKGEVKRVEASLTSAKRVVLIKNKNGISIYSLESYLSKVEFGQTKGVKTILPGGGRKKAVASEAGGG